MCVDRNIGVGKSDERRSGALDVGRTGTLTVLHPSLKGARTFRAGVSKRAFAQAHVAVSHMNGFVCRTKSYSCIASVRPAARKVRTNSYELTTHTHTHTHSHLNTKLLHIRSWHSVSGSLRHEPNRNVRTNVRRMRLRPIIVYTCTVPVVFYFHSQCCGSGLDTRDEFQWVEEKKCIDVCYIRL